MYHKESLEEYSFLVTGGAGFIGSNLVEYLLQHRAKRVVVLDNLSTGFEENLADFKHLPNFKFIKGDITQLADCKKACEGIDFVSNQAALGSVPRSIKDPIATHINNVDGFLNMLVAARDAGVKRFVYASSSSVYGDSPDLPKRENQIGKALSPYAVSKLSNELYAHVFQLNYELPCIGLRYFNVFGPKQSPTGAYAAAIPLFMQCAKDHVAPYINGDGNQTRDFTFVENAVQANIRSFFAPNSATGLIYNIAVGENITINELWQQIKVLNNTQIDVIHREDRPGDIRNSLADISLAQQNLLYNPQIKLAEGLSKTVVWFNQQA